MLRNKKKQNALTYMLPKAKIAAIRPLFVPQFHINGLTAKEKKVFDDINLWVIFSFVIISVYSPVITCILSYISSISY